MFQPEFFMADVSDEADCLQGFGDKLSNTIDDLDQAQLEELQSYIERGQSNCIDAIDAGIKAMTLHMVIIRLAKL